MPAAKKPSAVLLTTETLVERCGKILKPAEKRSEGWEWREFVCKFRDKTGVVCGGFLKENQSIFSITIFGKGESWNEVVSNVISLAMNDEKAAKEILAELLVFDRNGDRKNIFERKKTTVTFVKYDDGQLLLKIKLPLRDQVTKRSQQPAGRIAVLVHAKNAVYTPKNLGSSLTAFKKRFDEKIDSTARAAGIKKPKQFTQDGSLAYSFGTQSHIMVFAGDKKNVTQIFSSGTSKEAAEFWYFLEHTISSLNPKIKSSDLEQLLSELGETKRAALPKEDAEIENGKIRISYARAKKNNYVLQIWPARSN